MSFNDEVELFFFEVFSSRAHSGISPMLPRNKTLKKHREIRIYMHMNICLECRESVALVLLLFIYRCIFFRSFGLVVIPHDFHKNVINNSDADVHTFAEH